MGIDKLGPEAWQLFADKEPAKLICKKGQLCKGVYGLAV